MKENSYSLSQWVEDYTSVLYSRAYHKVSNVELAQDLVQETFLAAAEKVSGFEGRSTPKTWLFSILNNKIVDYYRKKVNQPINIDSQESTHFFDQHDSWIEEKKPGTWHEEKGNLLDDDEFQAILKMCLDALPEKWSMSVKLKYLSEKNGEEICQELGITPSNFWQIVHRAKLQLRDCIDNNWYKNN